MQAHLSSACAQKSLPGALPPAFRAGQSRRLGIPPPFSPVACIFVWVGLPLGRRAPGTAAVPHARGGGDLALLSHGTILTSLGAAVRSAQRNWGVRLGCSFYAPAQLFVPYNVTFLFRIAPSCII